MKRIASFTLSLICLLSCGREGVQDSGTHFAEEALRPLVESGRMPGVISVFYNNGVQETCCLGYADVENKRPIAMDNVFMQCSQTKGFCGVTVAKLVEEGRLNLDDPVYKYLPEFGTLWVIESENDSTRVLRKARNPLTMARTSNTPTQA